MRRGRGFSLPELLVSAGLLAIVGLLSAHALQPASRVWTVSQARKASEQSAMILRERVTRELQATTRDAVTAGIGAFAFPMLDSRPTGYEPLTGRPLWAKYAVYCLDPENRLLYRKEWPSGGGLQVPNLILALPTAEPRALTASELDRLCTTVNGTERIAARYVTGIRLDRTGSGTLSLAAQFAVDTADGLESRTLRLETRSRN